MSLERSLTEHRARLDALESELAATIAQKKIIYLDTNHWVHMQGVVLGRTAAKREYVELLSLLERLVTQGSICCPVSSSMFEELMKQSDTATRRVTAKLMDRLSQRVCLQFFLKLTQREWRQNVWNVILGDHHKHAFPVWTMAGFWAGQDDLLCKPDFWVGKSNDFITTWIGTMWSLGFEDVQALPDFKPVPDDMVNAFVASMNDAHERAKARLVSFDELRGREKFNLLRGLKDYLFGEPLPALESEMLPTKIFSSFVDEHNPKILPPLQIYASISAAVMRSNRTIRSHDAFDFIHAATAIPYCDAYFCDNPMKRFFTEKPLELDKVYDTTILSQPDEIIDYLNLIDQ